MELQKEKDVIGLGFPAKIVRKGFGFGISKFVEKGGISSTANFCKNDTVASVHNTSHVVIGDRNTDEYVPEPVEFYDENNNIVTTCLKLELYLYPEGFVLDAGKKGTTIFCSSYDTYFQKITSRNFKRSGLRDAKRFNSPKKALDYIKSKEDVFKFVIEKYGFRFSAKYASNDYASDVNALPKKEKDKIFAQLKELNDYLSELNNSSGNVEERAVVENPTNIDSIMEAIERMKDLNMYDEAIKSFSKGTVMMSEGAGILYQLDETAKKAIKSLLEMSSDRCQFTPYHVIHSYTNIGEFYDVLYVSSYGEDWQEERYSYTSGLCCAYVYNADEPLFSEIGSIRIEPCNGGLKRTYS